MKINYSLGQRMVAYLLLVSLLLQSCVDSIIPNPDPRVGEVIKESQPLSSASPEQELNIPVADQEITATEQPMWDTLAITKADDEAIAGAASISNELVIYQGEVNSEAETTRRKIESPICPNASLLFLNELPNDVLNTVLSYVGCKAMGQVRNLNKAFYKHTTSYEAPGKVGTKNKPKTSIPTEWAINKRVIDFNEREELTPESILSFPFYQLTGMLLSPPLTFWPYIKGTSVHTVDLSNNQIGAQGAADLVKALQGTRVHTVDLSDNQIGAQGAVDLAKALQGTSLHTVNLSGNEIGAQGAADLAKALQGTSLHTVDLSDNQIGAQGAADLAKALQGTSLHTVYLQHNGIGAQGAADLVKALQGTRVHTVNLSGNQIGAQGAADLAKALQGTSLHTVVLSENQIGDRGAADLAKALQETSVHTVVLNENQIGDQGAVDLAKALQGTRVHTVYLRFNYIGHKTQALLKQQYPHIQWLF
jgi:Ran GTPase-activating protein (RanGAP) involved in mRNA processing and transport